MNFPGWPVCLTWFREGKQNTLSEKGQNTLSQKGLYQPRNNKDLVAKPATFSTCMISSMYQGTMPIIIKTNCAKIYWSLVCYPLYIDKSQSIASLPAPTSFFNSTDVTRQFLGNGFYYVQIWLYATQTSVARLWQKLRRNIYSSHILNNRILV
jgi:hypothetical protein